MTANIPALRAAKKAVHFQLYVKLILLLTQSILPVTKDIRPAIYPYHENSKQNYFQKKGQQNTVPQTTSKIFLKKF